MKEGVKMSMHPSCHGLCLISVAYYFKGYRDKYKHSSQNKLLHE